MVVNCTLKLIANSIGRGVEFFSSSFSLITPTAPALNHFIVFATRGYRIAIYYICKYIIIITIITGIRSDLEVVWGFPSSGLSRDNVQDSCADKERAH